MLNSKTALSIEEQYEILSSGTVEFFNKKEFVTKLKTKKKLIVKAGFDPSRPDIHIGHSVLINKLCQFQDLGHQVIFVVGDFTACIGDPSGQNKTRPVLSFQEVKKNAQSYIDQVTYKNFSTPQNLDNFSKKVLSFFKRLDAQQITTKYNSQWLDKVSLRNFILFVCSKFTVAQQLERNDFSIRYQSKKPIGLHEFFYPILQAYDSLELKADVEIGGTDQTFNLLLGRDIQKENQQNPQIVLTLPLVEGLDGKQKMSKSLNNAITFNDKPKDMYGKVMKISDELLIRYWNLFTQGERDLTKESYHPKKEKEKLAWLLVCSFYGQEKAHQTTKEFERVFSNKGLPDQILECQDFLEKETTNNIKLSQLLKDIGLVSSTSEAKRKILEGSVRIGLNREKITEPHKTFDLKSGDEFLLSVGKRKFKTVNLKWSPIHNLKAYLVYNKIQKNENKQELCYKLSQDVDFKDYISLNSIKMKIENYRYLDKNEGLSNSSIQTKDTYNRYKNLSVDILEKEISKLKKDNSL